MQLNIGDYGQLATTGDNVFNAQQVTAIAFYGTDLALVSFVSGTSEGRAIAAQLALRKNHIAFYPRESNGKLSYRAMYGLFPTIEGQPSVKKVSKRLSAIRKDNIIIESTLFRINHGHAYVFSDEDLGARLREVLTFPIPDEWMDTFIIFGKTNRLITPLTCYGMEAYAILLDAQKWENTIAEVAGRYGGSLPQSVLNRLPNN